MDDARSENRTKINDNVETDGTDRTRTSRIRTSYGCTCATCMTNVQVQRQNALSPSHVLGVRIMSHERNGGNDDLGCESWHDKTTFPTLDGVIAQMSILFTVQDSKDIHEQSVEKTAYRVRRACSSISDNARRDNRRRGRCVNTVIIIVINNKTY